MELRIHSSVSKRTKLRTWPGGEPSLEQLTVKLHNYTGEQLVIVGSITVTELFVTMLKFLTFSLLIVKGEGPSLFGHNWLSKMKLDWCAINKFIS